MIWRRLMVSVSLLLMLSVGTWAQDETQPQEPNVTIHVVQRGETLFRIALEYGLSVDDIVAANGIVNPTSIIVGQRLLIPLGGVVQPPRTHIVQPGENLQAIATAYGVEVETLVGLNELPNPNALFIGQVLVIAPEVASTSAEVVTGPDAETVPDAATVTTNGITHVVQSGETLFNIAQQYGVTTSEIQQVNAIADATVIFAGQELVIPGVQTASPVRELPDAVEDIQFTPLTLVEGKTGRVQMTTRPNATVTLRFLGRDIPVISEGGNVQHRAFLAVPLETAAGVYPVEISIAEATGVTPLAINVQVTAGQYGSQYITLPADKAELISLAIEDNEYAVLERVSSNFSFERLFDGPMGLPAAAPMNAQFGSLRSYNGGPFDRYHNGADFAGAPGSPVLAAAPGRVVLADNLNIRGTTVMLDHGWGVFSNYSHMSERYVGIGDFVQRSQQIGTIGSTGRATGAHLHWEIWVNGIPVDPLQWVYQAFP